MVALSLTDETVIDVPTSVKKTMTTVSAGIELSVTAQLVEAEAQVPVTATPDTGAGCARSGVGDKAAAAERLEAPEAGEEEGKTEAVGAEEA